MCKGLPRQWSVADMKVWTAALELKHGLDLHCEAAVKSISQWTKVWGSYVIFSRNWNRYIFIMKKYIG